MTSANRCSPKLTDSTFQFSSRETARNNQNSGKSYVSIPPPPSACCQRRHACTHFPFQQHFIILHTVPSVHAWYLLPNMFSPLRIKENRGGWLKDIHHLLLYKLISFNQKTVPEIACQTPGSYDESATASLINSHQRCVRQTDCFSLFFFCSLWLWLMAQALSLCHKRKETLQLLFMSSSQVIYILTNLKCY